MSTIKSQNHENEVVVVSAGPDWLTPANEVRLRVGTANYPNGWYLNLTPAEAFLLSEYLRAEAVKASQ